MVKNQKPNKTISGTNIQHVRGKNAQSAQGIQAQNQQFGTEFGSETDVQQVKKQNTQAERNKDLEAQQQRYFPEIW